MSGDLEGRETQHRSTASSQPPRSEYGAVCFLLDTHILVSGPVQNLTPISFLTNKVVNIRVKVNRAIHPNTVRASSVIQVLITLKINRKDAIAASQRAYLHITGTTNRKNTLKSSLTLVFLQVGSSDWSGAVVALGFRSR